MAAAAGAGGVEDEHLVAAALQLLPRGGDAGVVTPNIVAATTGRVLAEVDRRAR